MFQLPPDGSASNTHPFGVPLNFGPGDPAMSHQPNEHVSIADLVDCTKAIALTLVRWCGVKENGK
ncbi:hypothetical protein QU24_13580 [Pantoea rodasii]|uniref:Peptidase M20 dimerisation domain-containing protein n=1 Tax=Pantoea rodasii TaxID=1076549 RepID=A0A0B1R8M2_9GAMM|nr:hypothetical protein QU24_13580 [Pantoea rodasii]